MRNTTLVIVIALAATPALGERGDLSLLAGPVAGGTFEVAGSDDLEVGSAAAVTLALHLDAPAGGQYELLYSRQRTDITTAALFAGEPVVDIDIEYFQLGGNIGFADAGPWRPYVLLTVGAARFDPDAADSRAETFFAMTGGLGLYRALGERVALRVEGRALASWVDSDTEVFCVSAGGAICAISADGDSVWQWAVTAGLAWRF